MTGRYTVFENTGKFRSWNFDTIEEIRSARAMFKELGLKFNGMVSRDKAEDIDVFYVSTEADTQTPLIVSEKDAWQYNACGKLTFYGRC